MFERRGDHVVNRQRLELQFDFAGVQPRHFRRFAHQPVQPVALFVDDRQQFVRSGLRQIGGSKAASSPKP